MEKECAARHFQHWNVISNCIYDCLLRTKKCCTLLRFSDLKRQLRYMKAVLPTICRAQIRDLVCQGLIRQIQLSFGLTAQLRIMTKHNERFQLVVWFVKLAFLGWERCTSEKMPPWMGGSFFFWWLDRSMRWMKILFSQSWADLQRSSRKLKDDRGKVWSGIDSWFGASSHPFIDP